MKDEYTEQDFLADKLAGNTHVMILERDGSKYISFDRNTARNNLGWWPGVKWRRDSDGWHYENFNEWKARKESK